MRQEEICKKTSEIIIVESCACFIYITCVHNHLVHIENYSKLTACSGRVTGEIYIYFFTASVYSLNYNRFCKLDSVLENLVLGLSLVILRQLIAHIQVNWLL